MTDYTKLVEALRGKFIAYDVTGNHNSARLYKDAADAIEALQAEVERLQVDVEAAYALMEAQDDY